MQAWRRGAQELRGCSASAEWWCSRSSSSAGGMMAWQLGGAQGRRAGGRAGEKAGEEARNGEETVGMGDVSLGAVRA